MPTAVTASTASQVTSALKRAGAKTGADFDFLMNMAKRESSLNPDAKAKTSSAAGLFQFIEQTWLGAVKQYGQRHGLEDYSADITRAPNGKFSVTDTARREEILNLRFDPNASAALAGELASENKSYLEGRLGRAAQSADLYTAHFLGPVGAVRLLSSVSSMTAAEVLPKAAAANKNVFYDGARAKSVGEVVASIAQSMGGKNTEPSKEVAPARVAASSVVEAKSASVVETNPAEIARASLQMLENAKINIATASMANVAYDDVKSFSGGFERAAISSPTDAMMMGKAATLEELSLETETKSSRLMQMALTMLNSIDPTRLGRNKDTSNLNRNIF